MCGIVGYIGKNNVLNILIKGLKTLEYRGYDSAGLTILQNEKIEVVKDKGRINNLEKLANSEKLVGHIGIAQTRWATHGVPSKENAHPHTDQNKHFAVVHNGIIENYIEIKDFLIKNGFAFQSQTDTEVIPLLLEYYYQEYKNVLDAFKHTLKDLRGSYAIEVITPFMPDTIFVAKKNSPLVIGKGNDGIYVASDIQALIEYTKDFFFLEDGEVAVINDNIYFYDKDFNEITKKSKTIDWEFDAIDKNGFDDYMLKEIYEQPEALKNTLNGMINLDKPIKFVDFDLDKNYIEKVAHIYIVACGTAMHAGLVGKYAIENLCRIPVTVEVASEFRYKDPLIDEKTLCIFVSQSGETADTIAAVKLAKEKKARTVAITNVFESSITREVDYTLYTHAGPEIAVASTKAYISQVGLLIVLAIYIKELINNNDDDINIIKNELLKIPQYMQEIINNHDCYYKLAKMITKENNIFYIGRGIDYAIALEGSLKLKEISYINSEAYPAGELKHGPIALIDKGTFVLGIITEAKLAEKTLSNLQEVKSRGANIILITNQKVSEGNIVNIPKVNSILSPMLAIIPLQFIAYYVAKDKGLDVDKPRNLAKSVTVE